jgi:cullin 3
MKSLAEMEHSGLVALVRDDKYEDLHRMYTLFKRADGGLNLVRTMLGELIKAQGKALVMDPEKVSKGGKGRAMRSV